MMTDGPVLRGLNVHPRLGAGEISAGDADARHSGLWGGDRIAEGRNLAIVTHAGPDPAVMIAYWHRRALRRGITPSPGCGGVVLLGLTATSASIVSAGRCRLTRTQW